MPATNPYSSGPDIELYAEEFSKAHILWAALQRKYGDGTHKATQQTMRMFKDEVEDRFKNEVGLIVEVGEGDIIPTGDGEEFVVSPIIQVVGRVTDKAFDFEKVIRETQLGHYDGKVGTIKEDGSMTEPQRYY